MAFDVHLLPAAGTFPAEALGRMAAWLRERESPVTELEGHLFLIFADPEIQAVVGRDARWADLTSSVWLQPGVVVLGVVQGDTDSVVADFARWSLEQFSCHLEEPGMGPIEVEELVQRP
jgi:hypothetical protein